MLELTAYRTSRLDAFTGGVRRSAPWVGESRRLPTGICAFMFQEPTQRAEVDVSALEVFGRNRNREVLTDLPDPTRGDKRLNDLSD